MKQRTRTYYSDEENLSYKFLFFDVVHELPYPTAGADVLQTMV